MDSGSWQKHVAHSREEHIRGREGSGRDTFVEKPCQAKRLQGGGGRHNGPRCGRACQSVKRGVRLSRHARAHSAAVINGPGTNDHVARPAPSELTIALREAGFSKR